MLWVKSDLRRIKGDWIINERIKLSEIIDFGVRHNVVKQIFIDGKMPFKAATSDPLNKIKNEFHNIKNFLIF